MRRILTVLLLLTFLTPAFLVAEHKISLLGTGSSFYRPPLKKPADLQKMVIAKKDDIQAILTKRGWTGNMDDLLAAVAAGKITETTIERGAHLPFMAMKHGGKSTYWEDVVWLGRKPIQAFLVEFDSNNYSYRMYIPKPCGNFWIEGKEMEKPTQPATKPSVRVEAPEVCVTQTPAIRVMVDNANPGSNVQVSVDGQSTMTFAASNGTAEKQLTAYTTPGSHSISVTLDGAEGPATASLAVKACVPTCSLAPLPPSVKHGAPVSIDASGSHVASGVSAGMKSVTVTVMKDQTVVDTFDLTAPNLKRDNYEFKKSGIYTVRAAATDSVGEKSENACEAQIEVLKPANPFFIAGYVGKERLVRTTTTTSPVTSASAFDTIAAASAATTTEVASGRCAALLGVSIGILPEINEHLQAELAVTGKFDLRDTGNTSMYIDAALNAVNNRWFFGGGVSFMDLTISDTRAAALLVQTGVNLDQHDRYQFVVEGRAPFNKMDDISNNYQFWGGIRFRFGH